MTCLSMPHTRMQLNRVAGDLGVRLLETPPPLPRPYCANFRLRCDTIDDSGGSTQRHDDVDKCANDLRHEMALEMWIVSVHEKSEHL